jgi:hypothetical protein
MAPSEQLLHLSLEELSRGLVGGYPIAVKQEVVNLVGKDQLLKVDLVFA